MAESSPSEIQINIKGPNELKIQINISTDKSVLDLKQAIAEKADVEADRQRLIYSGRVLKDEDPLSTYKIQSMHTIHMVKGVSRSAAGTSAAPTGAAPQQLPQMQTGQNPHDPLTMLNSHQAFGAMAGFNPFADMGVNPNDPNMMQNMMNSPQFAQQMASVMSNPAVLDTLMRSNPELAAMGPNVRNMFQNPRFQQLMSNPDSLRAIMQMSSVMHELNGPGGGGPSAFPAPGVPTTGATVPGATTGTSAASVTPGPGAVPAMPPNPMNPYGMDPAAMQQMMASMFAAQGGTPPAGGAAPPAANPYAALGGLGGLGGLGSFGGWGAGAGAAPATPADTRSPEERFELQLQQLQDMGFTNAQQNVRALLATAGNVHAAIEYILGGGGA